MLMGGNVIDLALSRAWGWCRSDDGGRLVARGGGGTLLGPQGTGHPWLVVVFLVRGPTRRHTGPVLALLLHPSWVWVGCVGVLVSGREGWLFVWGVCELDSGCEHLVLTQPAVTVGIGGSVRLGVDPSVGPWWPGGSLFGVCEKFLCVGACVVLSDLGRMVDALVPGADEGRGRPR